MGTTKKKILTLKQSVAMWLMLNLDIMQTKNLRDARLLQKVVNPLESKCDFETANKIRREHDQKLRDAQEDKEAGEASPEQEELLATNKFDWFKQVYREIDNALPAIEVSITDEALEYARDRLAENPFDGIGRKLLLAFADAIDEAKPDVEK